MRRRAVNRSSAKKPAEKEMRTRNFSPKQFLMLYKHKYSLRPGSRPNPRLDRPATLPPRFPALPPSWPDHTARAQPRDSPVQPSGKRQNKSQHPNRCAAMPQFRTPYERHGPARAPARAHAAPSLRDRRGASARPRQRRLGRCRALAGAPARSSGTLRCAPPGRVLRPCPEVRFGMVRAPSRVAAAPPEQQIAPGRCVGATRVARSPAELCTGAFSEPFILSALHGARCAAVV